MIYDTFNILLLLIYVKKKIFSLSQHMIKSENCESAHSECDLNQWNKINLKIKQLFSSESVLLA